MLRLDTVINTVTTKRDESDDGETAGVRHNIIVSDFQMLLQQADAANFSDWLAINDEKNEPAIVIAMLPVCIDVKLDAVSLNDALEEIGAGYEKNMF